MSSRSSALTPHLAAIAAELRRLAAELEAAGRGEGATAGGDTSPAMSPDELRAILAEIGWSQRQAGELTLGERRLRRMAAGAEPVPAALATWLRLALAFPPPRKAE